MLKVKGCKGYTDLCKEISRLEQKQEKIASKILKLKQEIEVPNYECKIPGSVCGCEGEEEATIGECELTANNFDDLKIFQMHKSDDENRSHPLVFKISKAPQIHPSSTFIPSNEGKIFSFDHEISSPEKIEENDAETTSFSVQAPRPPGVKKEKTSVSEPRRSLRLLALQNKLNSFQESENKNSQTSVGSVIKKKILTKIKSGKVSVKNTPNTQKQATHRKSSVNPSSSKFARETASVISDGRSERFIDPSTMELRSLLLMPTPRTPFNSSTIQVRANTCPKFVNVDPSKVLPTFTKRKNISKSLASGKAVSLFFPGGFTSQSVKPEQSYSSSNKTPLKQYKFRKANPGLLHLSKKYPMLDPFTLDKCYGMSNFSVKKTEIMLLDVIAGKEVFSTETSDFSCNTINKDDYLNIPHSHWYWSTAPNSEPIYMKQFYKGCCNNDSLSRDIIIQSLKVLNAEEAILQSRIWEENL